jgi:proteasome lid subunit RPN8/RPN11
MSAGGRRIKLQVERCWVLVGEQLAAGAWRMRRRQRVEGSLASVEAQWEWALKREETNGDVLGFFHTHPHGFGMAPSTRDVRTMQAWCSAFGKPLLCLIADGSQVSGYLFFDDESQGTSVLRVRHESPGEFLAEAGADGL